MTTLLKKSLPGIEQTDKEKIAVRIKIDPITADAANTLKKVLSKSSLNKKREYLFRIFGEKGL